MELLQGHVNVLHIRARWREESGRCRKYAVGFSKWSVGRTREDVFLHFVFHDPTPARSNAGECWRKRIAYIYAKVG